MGSRLLIIGCSAVADRRYSDLHLPRPWPFWKTPLPADDTRRGVLALVVPSLIQVLVEDALQFRENFRLFL